MRLKKEESKKGEWSSLPVDVGGSITQVQVVLTPRDSDDTSSSNRQGPSLATFRFSGFLLLSATIFKPRPPFTLFLYVGIKDLGVPVPVCVESTVNFGVLLQVIVTRIRLKLALSECDDLVD